jgi:hypothetical protein
MNALKLPELRKHRGSFKRRVAAAAQATARVLHFPRRSEMATKLQTLLPRVEHRLAERMRAAGEATARIFHLPRRNRHDADASPLTIYGGGGGGGTPDADAELFELGREFDEAVAAHEQWEREEYGPFIRGREHAPASEIPGLSEMEDRRGELVDAYDEIAAEIADLKPRTKEGLALMARVLRIVQPERFKPREEYWEDRLALAVMETALARAGIMLRGNKAYLWQEMPDLDDGKEQARRLAAEARRLADAAERLGRGPMPVPATEPAPEENDELESEEAERNETGISANPRLRDPSEYELVAAWHEGSEAPIRRAFANWSDAVRRLSATIPADGGDWPDRASEDAFGAAAKAEYEARRAVWTTEAYSLRALQMRALAFASDLLPHEGRLSDHADQMAAGYQEGMAREPLAGPPVHAFMAFSFARDLLRLAEADPHGPRYPSAEPPTPVSEDED